MKKYLHFISAGCFCLAQSLAQDTFSIVGIDTITGEVGSAGASCVDLIAFNITDPSFLGDLIPGKGAINTQASYIASNQTNANARMNIGDTPSQIISWLVANDVQSNPTLRQYGIAAIVGGSPQTAAYTGTNCMNYKNHITGKNYSIQGNILIGQQILDSMESKFKKTNGTLACKLMAALQGAKVVGADTRCTTNGTSSLFAFLKVSKSGDPYGSPYISIGVRTATNTSKEPIDSLQKIANAINLCSITTGQEKFGVKGSQFGVYPNPNNGLFSIIVSGSVTKNGSIEVVDCLGEVISRTPLSEKITKISLAESRSGIYFVRINAEDGVVVRKIIKE